jgi:choline dehydrogenase-like flavoprotein
MSSYDVIVIGSGAGGGTLVHRLAPVGQAHPPAGARRLAAARAPQLVGGGRLHRQPLHLARHLVRRRDGEGLPASGALLRRRRDEALRRGAVPAAPGGLRRAAHHDGISPAWPITYEEMEPYYTQAEQALSGARRRGGGPHRADGRARRIPSPPCPTSRASSSSTTTWPRRGISRSTRPAGSCSTRPTWHTAPASGARRATASHAWCTRSPTPRCWPSGRRSSTPT